MSKLGRQNQKPVRRLKRKKLIYPTAKSHNISRLYIDSLFLTYREQMEQLQQQKKMIYMTNQVSEYEQGNSKWKKTWGFLAYNSAIFACLCIVHFLMTA